MRRDLESPRGSAAILQQHEQIFGAPCENVRLNMSIVQRFSSQKTLNAQRSTLNAQSFSAFSVGRWTLDVGRCPSIPGGVAERLIAPVLKTGRLKGLVSSNLTPSASLVERAREAKCITVSHNKSANFQRNPTLLFKVVFDREIRG